MALSYCVIVQIFKDSLRSKPSPAVQSDVYQNVDISCF